MCISYKSRTPYRSGPYRKTGRRDKKHTPLNEKVMHPDPGFVDERIKKEVVDSGKQ